MAILVGDLKLVEPQAMGGHTRKAITTTAA